MSSDEALLPAVAVLLEPGSRTAQSQTSGREMLAVASGGLLLLLAEILVSKPAILFSRFLWADELQTKLIVSDPSLLHSLVALEHAPDPTPPAYYFLARGLWWLLGASAETSFRMLGFLATWLALLLTYAALRRTFAVLPSLLAVLALWSHPTVIHYTFFARPYPTLLAASAGFCLVYGEERAGVSWALITAAAAALLCTLHYYGIFSLAAIVMVDIVTRRRSFESIVRRLLPVVAGPIALLLHLPFLRGPAAGHTVLSYLPAFSLQFAGGTILKFFSPLTELAVGLILTWWISTLIWQRRSLLGRPIGPLSSVVGISQPAVLLSALLLVPLLQAILSWAWYNTLIDRYMIAGVLGATPLLAIIASRSPRRVLIAATIFVAVLGTWHVRLFAQSQEKWQEEQYALIAQASSDSLPVVTFTSHEAYVLYSYAPDLRARLFIADFRSSHRGDLAPGMWIDAETAGMWSADYPSLPRQATLDDLKRMGKFHLLRNEPYSVLNHPLFLKAGQVDPAELVAETLSLHRVEGSVYEVRPN